VRLTTDMPPVRPAARVLCVDDHPDVADTAVILLGLFGFDARAAYNGPSALAVAATFRPEVCFLDLNMPVMEGDELAVRLREQAGSRAMLLVCVTAMNSDEVLARLTAAGFHVHLVKPADPDSMLAVMRGQLGV
jgi:two-component system OmpR family response regulator